MDEPLILDRYRLIERIAAGGSAEVWRAQDEQLDRPVAVKRLHPHLLPDEASRRRLVAEARAAGALSHPVIVGVYDETGGIEVARTQERMNELDRRMASSASWGIEGTRLLTPAEVKEMVPFIDESVILGGFYSPGVGIVDSLQAGTLMREKAQAMGALTVAAGVEVTGIDVVDGHVRGVRTDQGDVAAGTVVIACGVWSPRIARMAGASIPLTPAVHQMIDIGPVPMFENTTKEVGFPIVRDMDTNMYERQHGTGFEIGSYAHRAILMDADDIPSIEASALSPTMLPFTKEDFDPQLEDSLELFPDIVGDESVGVKLAINGLLSLTPDGNPIIGETPEVKGLWSAAAVWIKEGPGTARAVAEWMTHGWSEIDVSHSDIARFYPHQRTREHVRSRTSEAFNKTYGIVHPSEQWNGERGKRLAQQRPPIIFFKRFQPAPDRERAGQQNYRVHAGHANGQTGLERRRPICGADAKHQVRADQTGEEHRLGAEEHHYREPGICRYRSIRSHRRRGRITAADFLGDTFALRDADAFGRVLRSGARYHYRGRPSVPTTVAWGAKDRILLPSQAREARRRLPTATHVELPGCGHVPMIDDPDLVTSVILEGTRRASPLAA